MKDILEQEIVRYIKEYGMKQGIRTEWGEPLAGFADARHPYILNLKNIIGPDHRLPEDVLPEAQTVIIYYVPFTKKLARINAGAGRHAAAEWAIAYEETNKMLVELSSYLIGFLKSHGYKAAVSEETKTFDREKLISNWSHRHFAYAAGMGTFGVNNMLITKKGCCGRYFSLVTDLKLEPGSPLKDELCIHKRTGKCLVCVKNCPVNALESAKYQRRTCYGLVSENAQIHVGYGSSYDGDNRGTEVCGKCVTASPCAFMTGGQPF